MKQRFTLQKSAIEQAFRAVCHAQERMTKKSHYRISLSIESKVLEIKSINDLIDLQCVCMIDHFGSNESFYYEIYQREFSNFLKKVKPKTSIEFSFDGDNLIATYNEGESFSFSYLDSLKDQVSPIDYTEKFTIVSGKLSQLINTTQSAIADDSYHRENAKGLLLESFVGTLSSVATNGHVLSKTTIRFLEENIYGKKYIVPRKTISALQKLLAKCDGDVKVSANILNIRFDFFIFVAKTHFPITITSSLIDDFFPDYQHIIDGCKKFTKISGIETLRLVKSLIRISEIPCDKDSIKVVEFSIFKGSLLVSLDGFINKENKSEPYEEFYPDTISNDCQALGELSVGFDLNYLVDTISTIDAEFISISFDLTRNNLIYIEVEEGDYSSDYVVMGIRR